MSVAVFGTTRFGGSLGSCVFSSLAPWALSVCAILRRAPRRGLTAEQIATRLSLRPRQRVKLSSGVLQRLLGIGVIEHPRGARDSFHYLLREWPEIDPA